VTYLPTYLPTYILLSLAVPFLGIDILPFLEYPYSAPWLSPLSPRRLFVNMGAGAILEPLVVIVLLFGGTWINRSTATFSSVRRVRRSSTSTRACSPDSLESGLSSPTAKDALLNSRSPSPTLVPLDDARWRKRQIRILSYTFEVKSPDTAVFQDRLLSRLLRKFPFLVECWYWALVYWVSAGCLCCQQVSFPLEKGNKRTNNMLTRHTLDISTGPCIHRGHPSRRNR
jgi:hypothetical protein